MAVERLEIEVDTDKGEVVGEIPGHLSEIFKRIADQAISKGRGEGIETATDAAKKQIEDAVSYQRKQLEQQLPFEKQRLAQLEADNSTLATKLSETAQESERARKLLDEQYAKDLIDRTNRIEAQAQRIRELTGKQIRGEAMAAGARDGSLDELEFLILRDIGFDENMVPFVKDKIDGSPLQNQGKPVTVEAYVRDYLSKNGHHRKAVKTGRDPLGRAASLNQATPSSESEYETMRQSVEDGDRSPAAINALFEANRARQRAG